MKTAVCLLLLSMIFCLGLVNALATTVEEEEAPLASFHLISDVHVENSDSSLWENVLKGKPFPWEEN